MYAQFEKSNKQNQGRAVANNVSRHRNNNKGVVEFEDNRPLSLTQRKLQTTTENTFDKNRIIQKSIKMIIQRYNQDAIQKIKKAAQSGIYEFSIHQSQRDDPFPFPTGDDSPAKEVCHDSHHIHLFEGGTYACHVKWSAGKAGIQFWKIADLRKPGKAPKACPTDLKELVEFLKDVINGEYDDQLEEEVSE